MSDDAPTSVFTAQWIAFRHLSGSRLTAIDGVRLARTLRRALQRYADDPIPELISGHQGDGSPGAAPHAAYLTLPLVGFPQASGEVAGMAIAVPTTAPSEQVSALENAITAWEDAMRRDDEAVPSIPLHMGRHGRAMLERVVSERSARTLRQATWCGPAQRWSSITPVVFDRYPGKLLSRDPQAVERAMHKARDIIARSCTDIGLPAPQEITIHGESPIQGVPAAPDFPVYPGIRARQKRFFQHVSLIFERPVLGPVILGAGRFEGMGLMRPMPRT